MRVHVQTNPADRHFRITPDDWAAAARLAGEPPHSVSFGSTPADFAAARNSVELLVGPPAAIRPIRPLDAPKLRMVFLNAAGVDALAPFDWLPEDAALVNNRGVHGPKAGAYVAMAVLMLAARIPALLASQRERTWRPISTRALAGQHVVIVGTGDLGGAGARALRPFGVRLTGVHNRAEPHLDFDHTAAVAELDALLPVTDVLVLACPLTPATRGLLDRRRLALLPPAAGVVNIGRGALLDPAALAERLATGDLAGAVLDVFDHEPLPPDDPLWATPNLIATPHISCDDPTTYTSASLAILFANLRAWRAGARLPNQVDPGRGY